MRRAVGCRPMSEVRDGGSLRAALAAIAGNLSFSWTPGARTLFADLDPKRFGELGHNPTALLSELTDEDLGRAFTTEYAMQLARVQERLGAEAGSATCRPVAALALPLLSSCSSTPCRVPPAPA